MYVFCKVYRRLETNVVSRQIVVELRLNILHFSKFKYIKFTGIEVVVPTARSSRGRAV